MAIIELQQLGGAPEQITGLTNAAANRIACAIMKGLLAGNGQVVGPKEFLVSRRVTCIRWRDAAATRFVTVTWEA